MINPAVKFTMHDVGQTDPQPEHVALHSTTGGHK
jgi:hypothetical protein